MPSMPPVIDLKFRPLAAVLAWLIPGAGHWYQGRLFKAKLFGGSILGLFLLGAALGSHPDHGLARVVYYDPLRPSSRAFHLICQAGAGLVTFPAIYQGWWAPGSPPWPFRLMAPPIDQLPVRQNANDAVKDNTPQLNAIHYALGRNYDIATTLTMIAGLLNILVIFDAASGPVFPEDEHPPEPASAGPASSGPPEPQPVKEAAA